MTRQREAKSGPRAGQDRSKRGPRSAKTAPRTTKKGQKNHKSDQDRPKTPQDHPKTASRTPKIAPREAQVRPRPPQDRPRPPREPLLGGPWASKLARAGLQETSEAILFEKMNVQKVLKNHRKINKNQKMTSSYFVTISAPKT